MAVFKLSTKMKWVLAIVFCVFAITATAAYLLVRDPDPPRALIPLVRPFSLHMDRYGSRDRDQPLQLVDVVLVKVAVDPQIKLAPEQQISNSELETVLIRALKQEILEEFPETKVTVEPYGRPKTLETNPFAMVWDFCLIENKGGAKPFTIQYTYYRRDEYIQMLSRMTYRTKGSLHAAKEELGNPNLIKNFPVNPPHVSTCHGTSVLNRPFTGKDRRELLQHVQDYITGSRHLKFVLMRQMNLNDEQYNFARENSEKLKREFYNVP